MNYNRLRQLSLILASSVVLVTPVAIAQPFPDGSTPKFFICPQGMTRFATFVTTKHDINLCGEDSGKESILALRVRGTRKIVTVPIVSNNDIIYVAQSANGTKYTLDTKKRLLSIQPKQGKIIREKVVASD
jgi:hypothetical protein